MSNAEVILNSLRRSEQDTCYDCLSVQSGVTPRQQVYQLCTKLAVQGQIHRWEGRCEICGRSKTVNGLLGRLEKSATNHESTQTPSTSINARTNAVRECLTEPELAKSEEISRRLEAVRAMLGAVQFPAATDYRGWHDVIAELRTVQGNVSNDLGFFATLMAKEFLTGRHGVSFDAAAKAQGAPGLDIDSVTREGERVIGEIKTTVPYRQTDFGAAQADAIRRDIKKLGAETADYKYLFVTAPAAFEALRQKRYLDRSKGIRLVLLTTGEEHNG